MRPSPANRDARYGQRLELRVAAELREQTSSMRFEIDVLDLSVSGFRCATSFTLKPGQTVYVTLPTLAPLAAKVIWADRFLYGCAFERPLYGAVFDLIGKRFAKR